MTIPVIARHVCWTLAGGLIAAAAVTACSSSPSPSPSASSASSSNVAVARPTPTSGAGSGATRSQSSGGATTGRPGGTKSGTPGGSQPSSRHGKWDTHYRTLASSHTVPQGSALKFEKLAYDVINGGWNIDAAFKYSGHLRGPILYFSLKSGHGRPTAATPFRLTTTNDLQVFVIAPASPRPTDVIIYQSKSNGDQGARLLTVHIPNSAFTTI